MSISQKLNETVIPAVMKFVNLKPVVALKDGILFILPLTLIGSVFLLLAQIPYQPFNDWMGKYAEFKLDRAVNASIWCII